MADISNEFIKDSFDYVLQSDLATGVIYRIGGEVPVNPTFQSGLTINDSFTFIDGTEYNGFVLTCDSSGKASWKPVSGTSSGFDTYVTGGTYSDGVITFTNNSGNTFTVTGLYTGYTDNDQYLFLSGGTLTGTLYGTSISATTISGGTFYGDGSSLILSKSQLTKTIGEGTYIPYSGANGNVDLGVNEITTSKLWLYDEVGGPDEKGSLHYADEALHFENSDGETLLYVEPGFMQIHKTGLIQSNLFVTNLTQNQDHYLPNKSGTILVDSDLSTYQAKSEKNQVSGYAGLDINGLLTTNLFPDSILGNVKFKGTYNGSLIVSDDATINGHTLPTASSGNTGWYFISTSAYTASTIAYEVGDWILSIGTSWSKVDNTDAVMSFNGRLGNIVLNSTDITNAGGYLSSNPNGYITGAYLPLSGGTMSGTLYATTISATTYFNLPTDVRVTGGTYSNGTATFTNNTGGTFTVNGFTTPFTGGSVNGLTASTISATTYLNLPSTSGLYLPLSGGSVSGLTKYQGTISGSQIGSIAILDNFERPTGTGITVFNAGAPVVYTYGAVNGATGADCRIETFGGQGNSGRLSTATSSSLFITSAYPTAAFNPIISANTSTLTWTFNMRDNETSTPSGWGPGSKQSGTILFCDNSALATGGYAAGTGWAVIGVQSASYGFNLVKFTNGLRGTITPIASYSIGGNGVTQYYSIKVVLTVATGAWTIYVRNDGSSFTDPASGTYINSGSGTDSSYNSGTYPNFAYVYNGTNSNAWWDNFKLFNDSTQLNLYSDALTVSNGNYNQINGFTVLSNLSGLTASNDSAAAALGVPLWGLYRNGNVVQIRIV